MTLLQAKEKAGKAIADARAMGVQITQKREKNEATAELETQFKALNESAVQAVNDFQRMEAEAELEQMERRLETPARSTERFNRGNIVNTPRLNRQQRREQQRLQTKIEMFSRAGVTKENFEHFKDAHVDAFEAYVREGNGGALASLEKSGFKPMESMALLSTTGDLGGFLVPDDVRNEVLTDLAGFAVMRGMCRVERTGSSALVFPGIQSATTDADLYSSGYTGAWRPEGYVTGGTAPSTQNQPKFGQTRIPVHVWAPNAVEVTQELLADSGADLDSILSRVIAETLGLDEDAGFINGDGVGKPLGVNNSLSGLSITEVNTGHATQMTYEGIIRLFSNLPAQYRQNARWLLNSLTLGEIMLIKDGEGRPLFPINAIPGQLLGKQMVFSEFMPDIGAGTNPMIFGDFNYYGIADRMELRIQRLNERFAPNVGLLPTARVGGQPLRTAAFRKMKVSA